MLLMEDKRKRFRVPEPPKHAGEFAWALYDALKRAGGYRALQHILMEQGQKISASHLTNLREGVTDYDSRVVEALIFVYPDIATRMHNAKYGGDILPLPLVDEVERIARERGIPAHQVVSTLVAEEIRRLSTET